jgi:hypothetical protein
LLRHGLRGEEGQERAIILVAAITRWAQFDPSAAAEWARSQASTYIKGRPPDELFEMALSEWAARDAVTARAWIDQLPDDQKPGALRGYLGALATRDPVAALHELERLPEDVRNQRTYQTIFRSWSSKDPRAAAQAAANLSVSDAKTRSRVMGSVMEIWGQQAPREALAWALQLPKPEEQSQLIRNVLGEWVQREPEAAISQLLSLPDRLRDEAARNVIENVARNDIEQARQIAERLPAGQGRDQALGIVAVNWAGRDPGAAADFVRNLSEGAAAEAQRRRAQRHRPMGEDRSRRRQNVAGKH